MEENFFNPNLNLIKYQEEKRDDLEPPRYLEIEEHGDNSSIPFEVKIDKNELLKTLEIEGTTKGAGLKIGLIYNTPPLSYLLEFQQLKSTDFDPENIRNTITRMGNAIFDYFRNGKELGSFKEEDLLGKISLNLGSIYNTALLMCPHGHEDVQRIFEITTAMVLAHEIGHSREPIDKRPFTTKTRQTIQNGAFVLIDATRRTVLPWTGISEPVLLAGELIIASQVASKAYKISYSERFARQYQREAFNLYHSKMSFNLRDEDQLQKDWDNSWGRYKELIKILEKLRI